MIATSIDRFREAVLASNLYDKEYFKFVFNGSYRVPLTRLVLRTVIERDDVRIRNAHVEHDVANLLGRAIRMDVMATDETATTYDVEFQRDADGARPQRARFNSSVIDANYDLKGVNTRKLSSELPDTYVIFFTETDIFGRGLPIYHVERMVLEADIPFNDGSHIIYVNGAYEGTDTPLGRLIHDFRCVRASDMLVPEFAARTRELKETEEGAREMSALAEQLWKDVFDEMREKAIAKASEESYNKGMNKGRREGMNKGRKEGMNKGRKEGIQLGTLTTLFGLVRDDLLSVQAAADRANLTLDAFTAKMAEYEASTQA